MLILVVGGGGAAIQANSTNQAALVVVHGDGRVQTRAWSSPNRRSAGWNATRWK